MGKKYDHSNVVSRAKTGAGRRAIESRTPKAVEAPKSLLALKGHATSSLCNAVLNDLCLLKKPLCKKLHRKNDLLPFEAGGEAHLENLARLNDCSLFTVVNHNKKRPHNIVFGRTFGFRILDMLEFGITNYKPLSQFRGLRSAPGSKPLLLFNGDDYGATETTRALRSLFLDVFRGGMPRNMSTNNERDDVVALDLAGVDRVIIFTLRGEKKVLFRQYAVELRKKKDSRLPGVVLKEAGPSFDLELRRSRLASDAMLTEAMKKPRDPAFVRKVKNVSRDNMGDKKGRIHLGKQDLNKLALARMKGLDKRHRTGDESRSEHPVVQGGEEETQIGQQVKNEQSEETQRHTKRRKLDTAT
ncbi:Ribosome production factor 2-like [Gracilariopsis chorda]|uniref:Ribosome production factor 2 homolog n=1 Tax=Gracilariopsis chorda TaxID=448386 RepID=A0A2V3IZ14_9FLOR|nr:Ribosome production factor 2-like [Gracilariopsis chorda]|eukprot:PXF47402.1 Ribosome production factor 2-like [Gracilariopsis chorda]